MITSSLNKRSLSRYRTTSEVRQARYKKAERQRSPHSQILFNLHDLTVTTMARTIARTIASLVMLLCAAQLTLCQEFDCSTKEGQLAFLQRGAETDPGCYNPVIGVLVSDDLPTANQIEDVCKERCAGVMLNFLRSTENCRNDEEAQQNAYFIESELCAYKDGDGKPETSCVLQSESDIRVMLACFGWYISRGSVCPDLYPDIPVTVESCEVALQTAVADYGCCLQNRFGTEESKEELTQYVLDNVISGSIPVPSGFEIDVTDPGLFVACGLSLPGMCRTQITSSTIPSTNTPTTPETTTPTTPAEPANSAAAPSSVVAPLVALLFGILAELFTF